MPRASTADVAAIYGKSLTTEETALVERRLAQVERIILPRIPDVAAQIDAEDVDVVDIAAEALLRVICNSEGLSSEQDGSYGYQLSREAADNSLRITAEEWGRLGIKPSRMFAITPNIRVIR